MSSFSDSNLSKKLTELNGTQQSIQTLSLWLIHHRKHSKTIVQVWQRELLKASSHKRLILVYLANDVIQNCKKKGPEFSKDFGTVIPEAFKVAMRDADHKMKKSLDRVLSVWEERGVYPKGFVKHVKGLVVGGTQSSVSVADVLSEPSAKKRKRKEEPAEPLSLRQEVDAMKGEEVEPVDSDELVRRLSELENSASCDAAIREKIAALPPEVSDISQLARYQGMDKDSARQLSSTVDDACVLLSDYNKRLAEELDERKNVGKMLRNFIVTQRDQLQQAEQKLLDYQNKLAKVTSVRHELKSHIENLPDLSLLPRITGGLAPLPSAGDLFH